MNIVNEISTVLGQTLEAGATVTVSELCLLLGTRQLLLARVFSLFSCGSGDESGVFCFPVTLFPGSTLFPDTPCAAKVMF